MRQFTITITGSCADEIPDEWVLAAAAAAEVQVIEPEGWETANVTTVTTIEHA